MKNLRLLDLRNAVWDGTPNYINFKNLTQLEELAVDYLPRIPSYIAGQWPPDDWEWSFEVLSSLYILANSGVRITLDNLSGIESGHLANIVDRISTVRDLNLRGNGEINDADMKALAGCEALESLNIDACNGIGELGLAYLADANRLKVLTTSVVPKGANLHQLIKMTSLDSLTLTKLMEGAWEEGSDELSEVLSRLGEMEHLRVLGVAVHSEFSPEAFKVLKNLARLETLNLTVGSGRNKWEAFIAALETAHYVPVKKLVLVVNPVFGKLELDGMQQDLAKKIRSVVDNFKGSESIESLELYTDGFSRMAEADEKPEFVALLAKFPNLKTIRLHTEYSEDIDNARAYAKKWLGGYDVIID